jgi:hypothetical protein
VRRLVYFKDRQTRKIDGRDVVWARSAAIAVIENEWADESKEAIANAAEMSEALGARLAPEIARSLGHPAITYGKAILLGSNVSEAIAAAMIHARIGKPIRAAVGGGAAVIPSNMKRSELGTSVDVPLGHKDDPWAFYFAETLTLALHDAPGPDEFVLCLAIGGEVQTPNADENLQQGATQ